MRHFKKIDWPVSLSLLFACVLTVIAACVEPQGPLGAPNVVEGGGTPVASVQITLAQSTLAPGKTTQALVVAKSADGKIVDGRVDFISQNPAIVRVSAKGLVTADIISRDSTMHFPIEVILAIIALIIAAIVVLGVNRHTALVQHGATERTKIEGETERAIVSMTAGTKTEVSVNIQRGTTRSLDEKIPDASPALMGLSKLRSGGNPATTGHEPDLTSQS